MRQNHSMMTRGRMYNFALLAGLLAFAAVLPQPVLADNAISPALFGSNEIRSPSLKSFTNWTGVMSRSKSSENLGLGMCASAAGGSIQADCSYVEWQDIIAELRTLPRMEQLKAVNQVFNDHPYILDNVNWGMEDYWATVFEFIRRDGDCEDYAIAKYVTLRALGWSVDDLRIVIVHDNKLRLNHAILAAYVDGAIYIGDNQISSLAKAERIHHYRPIYSINENAWWLHRPKARG